MTHVILTCYFTTTIDPMNREISQANNGHIPNDNFDMIKKLYLSITKLKLNCVIFHDNLSQEFITKYQNNYISFYRVSTDNYKDRSINDTRFILYYDYLLTHHYDKICITDAFDVVFIKNPFTFIDKDNFLYGCAEGNKDGDFLTIKKSDWICTRYNKAYHTDITKDMELHLNKQAVNAGVLGGTYNTMISLLKGINNDLMIIDKSVNSNMAVVNKVAYELFDNNMLLGPPFCTRFKKLERNRTDCYIRHK